MGEVGEAARTPVDRVDRDQRVDELLERAPVGLRRRRPGLRDRAADRLPVDALHHVEGRAEHVGSSHATTGRAIATGWSLIASRMRNSRSTSCAVDELA